MDILVGVVSEPARLEYHPHFPDKEVYRNIAVFYYKEERDFLHNNRIIYLPPKSGKLNFEGILSFHGILYQTSAKIHPLLNNVVISIHRGKIRLSVREAFPSDRIACFMFVSFQHLSSEKMRTKPAD